MKTIEGIGAHGNQGLGICKIIKPQNAQKAQVGANRGER
jgi:hypothetical protein